MTFYIIRKLFLFCCRLYRLCSCSIIPFLYYATFSNSLLLCFICSNNYYYSYCNKRAAQRVYWFFMWDTRFICGSLWRMDTQMWPIDGTICYKCAVRKVSLWEALCTRVLGRYRNSWKIKLALVLPKGYIPPRMHHTRKLIWAKWRGVSTLHHE